MERLNRGVEKIEQGRIENSISDDKRHQDALVELRSREQVLMVRRATLPLSHSSSSPGSSLPKKGGKGIVIQTQA